MTKTFELNDEMAQAATELLLTTSLNSILREVRISTPSLHFCEDCGADIPEARRRAVRGVRLCIGCQEVHEHHHRAGTGVTYDR